MSDELERSLARNVKPGQSARDALLRSLFEPMLPARDGAPGAPGPEGPPGPEGQPGPRGAPGVGAEVRLDYEGGGDDLPRYIGRAAPGSSADAPAWTVHRVSYDRGGRVESVASRAEVAWSSRASLDW